LPVFSKSDSRISEAAQLHPRRKSVKQSGLIPRFDLKTHPRSNPGPPKNKPENRGVSFTLQKSDRENTITTTLITTTHHPKTTASHHLFPKTPSKTPIKRKKVPGTSRGLFLQLCA
jgi:hypothetical protein